MSPINTLRGSFFEVPCIELLSVDHKKYHLPREITTQSIDSATINLIHSCTQRDNWRGSNSIGSFIQLLYWCPSQSPCCYCCCHHFERSCDLTRLLRKGLLLGINGCELRWSASWAFVCIVFMSKKGRLTNHLIEGVGGIRLKKEVSPLASLLVHQWDRENWVESIGGRLFVHYC